VFRLTLQGTPHGNFQQERPVVRETKIAGIPANSRQTRSLHQPEPSDAAGGVTPVRGSPENDSRTVAARRQCQDIGVAVWRRYDLIVEQTRMNALQVVLAIFAVVCVKEFVCEGWLPGLIVVIGVLAATFVLIKKS
jgi:hypothetical protein